MNLIAIVCAIASVVLCDNCYCGEREYEKENSMTAPYKKRAKAGWNRDKKQSNKDERAFNKQELEAGESAEITSEAPAKKIKKPAKAKDIKNKIHAIERKLEFFKARNVTGSFSDWIKKVIYEKELEDLKRELNEKT